MATTVGCKCGALYEASSFLGGHTFTCNVCGAKVTIRDLSSSTPTRTPRSLEPNFLPTNRPAMVRRLVWRTRLRRVRVNFTSLFRFRAVQKVIAFLGTVVLLLVLVYPEYEITYYLWVDHWVELGGKTQRTFITDVRHGEIVPVLPAGDLELWKLAPELRSAHDASFERRTAIRIRSVALQGLLVISLTLLALWLSGWGKKGEA